MALLPAWQSGALASNSCTAASVTVAGTTDGNTMPGLGRGYLGESFDPRASWILASQVPLVYIHSPWGGFLKILCESVLRLS